LKAAAACGLKSSSTMVKVEIAIALTCQLSMIFPGKPDPAFPDHAATSNGRCLGCRWMPAISN
jgi:hypothetical protein